VTTDFLFESYARFAKDHGERQRLDPVRFGKFLHDMGFDKQTRSVETFDGEVGVGHDAATRKNPRKKPGYRLGTLGEARAAFARATGLNLTWPEDGIVEPDTPDQDGSKGKSESDAEAAPPPRDKDERL
jgi:hypothetical protein